MDQHRPDADPDPNFHVDAVPDPDPERHQPHADPTPRFTDVGKSEKKIDSQSQQCQFLSSTSETDRCH